MTTILNGDNWKMKTFLNGLKSLTFLTGIVSTITWIIGLLYADKRLHETTNNYKFGPMRHLSYLSNLVHRTDRMIGDAALDTWREAQEEDAAYYQRIEDEHDRLFEKARANGTWK